MALSDMSHCFSVSVKGLKLYDKGILAGVYMHYRAYIPSLESLFFNVVGKYNSVMFFVYHRITSADKR